MAFSASILVVVNLLVTFASSETGHSHYKNHHTYSSNRYKLGNELRIDEIREELFCRHMILIAIWVSILATWGAEGKFYLTIV